MKVVGLTGGIGSGKTTVANFFRELGVSVYIADDEAKELMSSSLELQKKIIALFGEQSYKNGIPDRKFIASHVFGDKQKLEALNNIIHPEVRKHFEKWKQGQKSVYVIYESAILFEKEANKKCDLSILVVADHGEKVRRLQKRDNSTLEEIEARMANQWQDAKKAKLADFVIKNMNLSDTWEEVRKIHENILHTA